MNYTAGWIVVINGVQVKLSIQVTTLTEEDELAWEGIVARIDEVVPILEEKREELREYDERR